MGGRVEDKLMDATGASMEGVAEVEVQGQGSNKLPTIPRSRFSFGTPDIIPIQHQRDTR